MVGLEESIEFDGPGFSRRWRDACIGSTYHPRGSDYQFRFAAFDMVMSGMESMDGVMAP